MSADNDGSHAGWTDEILCDWFSKGAALENCLATKPVRDMGSLSELG